MYVIIVGASKIGQTLADLLIAEKHNVVMVEKDEAKAKKLAELMDAVLINGSGTEIDVLNEAGAEKADVIVPATSDDAVNLMVCELAKILGIQRRITLSTNPKHEEIFHEVGVEHIIYPSGTISNHLKNLITRPGISNILLSNGEAAANIVEIIIPEGSETVGRMIKDLGIPEGTIIAGIHRNSELMIPGGSTVLEAGDKLTVLGKSEYIDKVSEILRK
jgi:trk system potassium uptake protein TrkA